MNKLFENSEEDLINYDCFESGPLIRLFNFKEKII